MLARSFALLLRALLGTLVFAPPPALAQTDEAARGLPYLTLRDHTGKTPPRPVYGDNRSTLKAGWCDIAQTRLKFLAPLAEASTLRIPEELLRIGNIREKDPATIFDSLEASTGTAAPVLYTHGFFIDFDKGCRRATLFQENIGAGRRFLWFSWPSDGAIFNYTHDESDLYWSVPELTNAIIEMVDRFGPDRVNVAGHSLGGRGIVLALSEVAIRRPNARLGEVILLAPDLDLAIFEKILPRIRPIARGITVYVSDSDRPLALSEQVHGYARLGQAGNDVSGLTGVEVIDISGTPVRSPTGHLYHIYNPEVGQDLNALLTGGTRAAQRKGLSPAGPNLWYLSAPE